MKNNLFFLLLLCFYGCGSSIKQPIVKSTDSLIPSEPFTSQYENTVSFCDEQISVRKKLISEKIPTNNHFFSYDFIYNKGLIYAVDVYQAGVTKITVYDTLGMFRGNFLNVGRGTNEILGGRILTYKAGEYSFLDYSQNKLVVFTEKAVDDFLKNRTVFSENTVLPDRIIKIQGHQGEISNAIPFDNGVVCLPQLVDTGNAVAIVDTLGNLIRSFGEYVPTLDRKVVQPIETNQCRIVLNDEQNRLAIFYINTDLVEFYDIDKGVLLNRVHGPHGFYINYKDHRESVGDKVIQSARPGVNSRTAYTKAVGRAGKIWALYSGRPRENDNYPTSLVYVFDWNGTPVACYELEGNNACFDVDIENNKIIALQFDNDSGEMAFYRYQL